MWLKHLIYLLSIIYNYTTPITQFLIFLSQILVPPPPPPPPPPTKVLNNSGFARATEGKTIFPRRQDKNNGKYSRNIVVI